MTPDTITQTVLFPGSVRQAPRRHVQPGTREFRRRRRPAQGGRARVRLGQGVRQVSGRQAAPPGKIRHTFADLIGQRIFGIACGHPDGNDADHLADDPIHKLLLGRDPVSGAPLASQPTISRFENGPSRTALYRMGRELAACVIERHRRRLKGRARAHHHRSGPDRRPNARDPAAHVRTPFAAGGRSGIMRGRSTRRGSLISRRECWQESRTSPRR